MQFLSLMASSDLEEPGGEIATIGHDLEMSDKVLPSKFLTMSSPSTDAFKLELFKPATVTDILGEQKVIIAVLLFNWHPYYRKRKED